MIGQKEIQRYRDMPLEAKLREFEMLMDAAFEFLEGLPPEERRRRWALWEEGEEESARSLAERLSAGRESGTEGLSQDSR